MLLERRVRAWSAYLAVTTAAGLLYLLGPSFVNNGPVFNALGASAVVAIVVGSRRATPRLPWLLFAAGQSLFVVGDVLAYNYRAFFGRDVPSLSVADIAYLLSYPALIAGVLLLVRRRTPGNDWAGLIDSLVMTIGLAALSWIFLMAPYARDPRLSPSEKLISIAYPLMDVLLLAVFARLAVGGGHRGGAFFLIAGGIAALLATDSIYGYHLLHGGYEPGQLLDGGWIAFYALLGTAALHPSATTLAVPLRARSSPLGPPRLALLAAGAGVAPVASAIALLTGRNEVVTAGASGLLFALVVGRMAGLVRTHAEAERRERALREAGARLVAATDRASVVEAAVAAAKTLVGGDARAALRLPHEPARPEWPGSFRASVPLVLGDRVLGELVVSTPISLQHGERESLEALAIQVALSLERADLTETLHRRESEARVAALVQNSSDAIAVVDSDGSIAYVTPSVERVLGYLPDDLVGGSFLELVDPEDVDRVRATILQQADGLLNQIEYRLRHFDGRIVDVVTVHTDLRDDARVGGIVLTTRDISERKRFEEELQHQAFHDALTGLANRALFRDRLEHALALHRHEGSRVAVLFLDLDDFKTINDSLGHLAGDTLLHDIGQRILGCVRESDTAARIGGDEFGVLLEGLDDPSAATVIAERLLDALARPFLVEGRALSVQASLGLAFGDFDDGETSAEALLRNADVAMYAAKGSGKRGYHVFEPAMHVALLAKGTLKADLGRALQEGQIAVHYQPIVSLGDRRIVGFEALARWLHPTRGLVDPNEFVPLAEESGLIVPIGRLVLRETCAFGAAVQERGPRRPIWISVNLSARQLQQPTLADVIRQALETSGLAASELVLEITESTVMEDVDTSIRRMHELKRLGVRLAVDDFGSGYSSLNYVRRFPVDILKIDRSFVSETREGEVSPLTRAIVELARVMGLRPVAEGIESAEQLVRLLDLGCELGQGFLFSSPLPAPEALALLAGAEQVAA